MKKIRTQEEAMQEMKHKVDPRGKQKPDKDISQSTVAKTGHGKEIKIRRNQVIPPRLKIVGRMILQQMTVTEFFERFVMIE